MRTCIVVAMVICLLAAAVVQAQGPPEEAYRETCTTDETDLAAAAVLFETTEEEVAYVNRGRDEYREDYLIRPGCFFSTELYLPPLYAGIVEEYPFVIQIIEADAAATQIAPEGYFSWEGFGGYRLRDFTFVSDEDGRWIYTAMALATGVRPFVGHGITLSGGGFNIRLEYDWIGQTFLHTILIPQGPILTVQAGYNLEDELEVFGLFAIDYESGDMLWTVELDEVPTDMVAASAAVAVVVYEDRLVAVDVADGSEIWSLAGDSPLVTAAGERLVVAQGDGLSAHDIDSGDALWAVTTDGSPYTHLVFAGDLLVTAASDGGLTTFAAADGSVVWEAAGTGAVTPGDLQCDAAHDCWLASSDDAKAWVEQFSMADGEMLAVYPLPGETGDSTLQVRVQPDGWVLIMGTYLHVRTPTLVH